MRTLSGGIDIGSEQHVVVILDETGKTIYQREVEHSYPAFEETIGELKTLEKKRGASITFAIEGKNGYSAPFDRLLVQAGFTLFNIDNLKLRNFRSVFGAECKTDPRDAHMLAKLMSLKDHIEQEETDKVFIAILPSPLIHEQLKILSRYQRMLIEEKTRYTNRLKKKVLEFCPDLLKIFPKVDQKRILRQLIQHPNISQYKHLTVQDLKKIKGFGCRTIARTLGSIQSVQYEKDFVEEFSTVLGGLAKRLLEAIEEIEAVERQMEQIGEKSKDVKLLKSLPGIAVNLSSRFMGEVGYIERFKKESQLSVYSGIGCINDDSGQREQGKSVFKANKILKNTLMQMAENSMRHVEQSRRYYLKKRREGKTHNHALRCLARQLIKVIFRMLSEQREYYIKDDPSLAA